MKPFLTCSSLPQRLHRSPIVPLRRSFHRRRIWVVYAPLKPCDFEQSLGGDTSMKLIRTTSSLILTLVVLAALYASFSSMNVAHAATTVSAQYLGDGVGIKLKSIDTAKSASDKVLPDAWMGIDYPNGKFVGT